LFDKMIVCQLFAAEVLMPIARVFKVSFAHRDVLSSVTKAYETARKPCPQRLLGS
jgi:hypothetical protein